MSVPILAPIHGGTPFYEFGAGLPGKPSDSQVVFLALSPGNGQFPPSFSGAAGKAGTNPTSSATYTVKKNGSTIGTISISTSGVFTFVTSGSPQAAQSFSKDDEISITAPSPADATLSDVCIRLEATRS